MTNFQTQAYTDGLKAQHELWTRELRAERDALQAENAKLREALQAVMFAVELEQRLVPSLKGKAWTDLLATARTALEGQP